MRLILSCVGCLALSACATDFTSQLSEPGFGQHRFQIGEENVDPSMLANGVYASRNLAAGYLTGPSSYVGAICPSYGCSRETPLWAAGWAP